MQSPPSSPSSNQAEPHSSPEELGGATFWLSSERILLVGLMLCALVLAGSLLELRLFASTAQRHWQSHLANRALALELQGTQLQLQWLRQLEQSGVWPEVPAGPLAALSKDLPEFQQLCVARPPQWLLQCPSGPGPATPSVMPAPSPQTLMPNDEPLRWQRLERTAPHGPVLAAVFSAPDSQAGQVIAGVVDEQHFLDSLARAIPDKDFTLRLDSAHEGAGPSTAPAALLDGLASWVAWVDWPQHLPATRLSWQQDMVTLSVSLLPEQAAREWRLHVLRVGGCAAAMLLLFAGLTFSAYRSWSARLALRQRLAQARRALHEQLAFSAHLLEASPTPTYVKDTQGRYLHVNGAYERHVDMPRSQLLGHTIDELLPDLDTSRHRAQDQAVMAGSQTVATEYQRLRPEHGEDEIMLVTKAPLRDESGRVMGLIGTITDISAQKRAERSIATALDAAQAANAAKSEFIGNMSHELRTPLQSILGFSELGISRTAAEPRLQDMFKTIWRGGDRMLKLVNDLLDLSKIDALGQSMRITPRKLWDLASDAAQELQPLASSRRMQIDVQVDPALLVAVDPLRFWQVLRNVLANALKFAPEGSTIVMRQSSSEDGQVVLDILDEGPGIPEDELESIFNPFVQSSRTKDGSGGTGLGLAICQRIIQAHGGHIQAMNRQPLGACFRITLPEVACESAGSGSGLVLPPTPPLSAAPAALIHTETRADSSTGSYTECLPDACQACPARLASGKPCDPDPAATSGAVRALPDEALHDGP
ncbi:MAG: PAS domain S-box protein [Burkholderiaceae bacterium]|nr:MAG: PAS domain S-box protein [Burkholderiaceae bacterium]